MRYVRHIILIAAALFVCLGIPSLYYYQKGTLFRDDIDAVSSASMEVPEQPSGTFVVLLNRARHPLTEEAWTAFFREEDVDVIMEDISCLVSRDDAYGTELAERYRARLAENQMKITSEDGTLVASRADYGMFDVIVLSSEAARVYGYQTEAQRGDIAVIAVGENEL